MAWVSWTLWCSSAACHVGKNWKTCWNSKLAMDLAAHWRSRQWGFSSQVVYCVFAVIGMELFHGKIQFFPANSNAPYALECGNPALKDSLFARAKYCKNNFNNFVSSFIVLMELTVVNQWHDILCGGRSKLELGDPHSSPCVAHTRACSARQQRNGPRRGLCSEGCCWAVSSGSSLGATLQQDVLLL